jgi:hypothetical protein
MAHHLHLDLLNVQTAMEQVVLQQDLVLVMHALHYVTITGGVLTTAAQVQLTVVDLVLIHTM